MIRYIDTDYRGIRYFMSDFIKELDQPFPWGEAMFDCQLFPPPALSSLTMLSLLSLLPYEHIDWVHTSEPNSEYWHDEVDRASVQRGVQKQVGEGKPMTAWFKDLMSLSDWELSHNLGVSPHFLFVFVDPKQPTHERMNLLRRKIHSR